MPEPTDTRLLEEYVARDSQEAFEALVRRHINLVFSTACRQVGDPDKARDIAQAVFIILARKAPRLRKEIILSGWLYQTTRLTANAFVRGEQRRQRREQEAFMRSEINHPDDDGIWQQLAPILDEAMGRLGADDRHAIVLRFFEGLNTTEAAAALRINEAAFRKRVERALEKLRRFFARRGVVISAATVGSVLAAHAVKAAPACVTTVIAAAVAGKGAAAGASALTLTNTTLKLMAWTKTKIAVAAAAGLLLATGTATVTLTTLERHGENAKLRVLPDGSFVRLLSTSVGTRFDYRAPSVAPWQRAILTKLPSSVASRFDGWLGMGGGRMTMVGPNPGVSNLAVFAAVETPSRSGGTLGIVAFDDQGNSCLASAGAGTIGNDDGRRSRTIRVWVLGAFPRRSKTVGLRVVNITHDESTWQTMAEFHTANPFYAKYPVWEPEDIPATKSDGDLAVTLTSLDTGVSLANPTRPAAADEVPATRATFRIDPAGQAGRTWEPKAIELSDATGNRWRPYWPAEATRQNGCSNELTFIGALWRGESAWKMRVEFARTSGFYEDEQWTVSDLRVPASSETVNLDQSATVQGVTMKLVAFTGSNADQPGNLMWQGEKGEPRISIRAQTTDDNCRVSLVKVVDQRGRAVEVDPDSQWTWSAPEKVFGLKAGPGVSSVSCTFAVQRSRYVEFLARPEYASK